jgi:hypothetical protein
MKRSSLVVGVLAPVVMALAQVRITEAFAATVCESTTDASSTRPEASVTVICREDPPPTTRPPRSNPSTGTPVNSTPPETPTVDPRVTPVFPSATQSDCTLPDGRPGVQVVIAPVLGTAFEIQCVDPGQPLPVDAVVRPVITIEQAVEATDFPRISAHMTPGPHGGLAGFRYAVHLEGVTTPTIAPSVQGVALRGRGTAIMFTVSTDTGSNRGNRDPDGGFTSRAAGSPDREAGSLVWQTGGMKSIRVVTRWQLEYEVSYNDGQWISLGDYEVDVADETPYPISGLTTQITSTE